MRTAWRPLRATTPQLNREESMLHRTYIFESDNGAQIAVEVWPEDAIDVKVRPASSAVWGLPLRQVSVEGDLVQFSFEEEA
jgi:hypothetical protein